MEEMSPTTDTPGFSTTPRLVEISLNEQAVMVPHRVTGLQIKVAAIDQGVNIKPDFILSEERRNGRDQIIGDGEEISVQPGSRFMAVTPDDNS